LHVAFTNSSTGSNTYLWIFDGENKSSLKDPKFVYVNPDTYTVLLISSDSSKCPDTARVQIKVYEKFSVFIPNVFTPNGDGRNDSFTINTTGIESLYGEIYDRWGLKMFSWDLKNDGWDGRSPAGTTAPEGTYYYVLKIKPQDGGKEHIEKGSLTLLR
jgi:gliding motility-associated-like protein